MINYFNGQKVDYLISGLGFDGMFLMGNGQLKPIFLDDHQEFLDTIDYV